MVTLFARNGIYRLEWVENGKTIRRSLHTTSRPKAQELRRQIEEQLRKDDALRAENNGIATVRDLCNAFKAFAGSYYRKNGQAPPTNLRCGSVTVTA